MKLELAKGVKDVDPRDQIFKNELLSKMTRVFERAGFNPLDTPMLERLGLFEAKGGGGSEIMKEVFKLKDQGERELGLRFDLTVPFARYVGMNSNLKLPFKRYQIGKVFRDGPIKLGRYREFYQCDIDIYGATSMLADAEILSVAKTVFDAIKLDVKIVLNNRKIIDGILEYLGIEEEKKIPVIISLDKLEKIGLSGVEKELMEIGLSMDKCDELFNLVQLSGTNEEKISFLRRYISDNVGLDEVEEIIKYAPFVIFDPSLARGLNYYTGPVFEVFLKSGEFNSSLAGGGRYDKMISEFLEREEESPATGIAFGLDAIVAAMKTIGIEATKLSVVELFVVPIKTSKESFILVKRLRDEGINCEMDLFERGVSKNLDYADKYKIDFVLIVGSKELEAGNFTLKNMESGKEELLSFEEVVKRVKNARS